MTKAAFFRVEGTLVKKGAPSLLAYLAANAQEFSQRLAKLAQMTVIAPVYRILGQNDRNLANRMAYFVLRGMSEDRLTVLGEEYFDNVLVDDILSEGWSLLKRVHREGYRIVLFSDSLDYVIEPLARHLKDVDHFFCNRLEFKSGSATGKLLDPIIGGASGGHWILRQIREQGIDLSQSVAYAARGPDLFLMDSVGKPCAVNPDFVLRLAAREAKWPILDYRT